MNLKKIKKAADNLAKEIVSFNEEIKPKIIEVTTALDVAIDDLNAKLGDQELRNRLINVIASTEPKQDASQLILGQWISEIPALRKPELAHYIITSANIHSPLDQPGHKYLRIGGEAVFNRALRSVHAGCAGVLDAGFLALNFDLFKDPSVNAGILRLFCVALNPDALEEIELDIAKLSIELEKLQATKKELAELV